MNKKILTLLTVFLVAISIASVCAVELTKENDFDGKFKMNCSENNTFYLQAPDIGDGEFVSNQSWVDDESGIIVCYYEEGMDDLVPMLKSNTLFIDEPKVDGNLTIFEDTTSPEGASYAVKYFVGVSSPENTTVFVGCDDLDLAKEYANTIVFE